MWIADLLKELLPGVVIAIVTAAFTVRLSVRQFSSERWWERKIEVYSRILDALYHIERYYDILAREEEGAHFSQERRERTEAAFDAAIDELHKATNLGAYLVSDEAAKVLSQLRARPSWDDEPPLDRYQEASSAYSVALAKIRAIAKSDLGVERKRTLWRSRKGV